MPRDQQNKEINNKHTDYEGLAYLGELPLAWAACCGNQTVYNLLIDAGANPDAQDSFGNMILHMVVVCDKLVRDCKYGIKNVKHYHVAVIGSMKTQDVTSRSKNISDCKFFCSSII